MDEPTARKIASALGITILAKSDAGWLQARCPLAPWTHAKGTDRHPGFGILINQHGRSTYKCLACKYKGRVSDLVRTLERFRKRAYPGLAGDADRADLAGAFGNDFDSINSMVTSEFEEPEPVDEAAFEGIYPPAYDVPEAAAYLANVRGIVQETAEFLGLCYDPEDYRVMFPVRGRQGELYGFTGRSILKEEVYPYRHYPKIRDYLGLPKRALLLGAHLWQPGKPSFVVEGLFGFANLVQQNVMEICNPLALLGSEMTPAKANLLTTWDENIYLMVDPDEGGDGCLFGRVREDGTRDADSGAIAKLKRKSAIFYVPEWPEGKTDPDQLTFEDVEEVIRGTPPWTG